MAYSHEGAETTPNALVATMSPLWPGFSRYCPDVLTVTALMVTAVPEARPA